MRMKGVGAGRSGLDDDELIAADPGPAIGDGGGIAPGSGRAGPRAHPARRSRYRSRGIFQETEPALGGYRRPRGKAKLSICAEGGSALPCGSPIAGGSMNAPGSRDRHWHDPTLGASHLGHSLLGDPPLGDPWSTPLEQIDVSDARIFQNDVWPDWFARLRRDDPVHYALQTVSSDHFGRSPNTKTS